MEKTCTKALDIAEMSNKQDKVIDKALDRLTHHPDRLLPDPCIFSGKETANLPSERQDMEMNRKYVSKNVAF